MIFKNALVFCDDCRFSHKDIEIENGLIVRIGEALEGEEQTDMAGMLLIPGLIDIHTHGCMGFAWQNADNSQMDIMARFYAQNGITSVVPTVMTAPLDSVFASLEALSAYRPADGCCAVRGIHLEGIFLSHEKRGAHDEKLLLDADPELFWELERAARGRIIMVCVAPELPGAKRFISEISPSVRLSLAHSNATYDQTMEAFSLGASHVTHLYNGMRGFSHREPGVVGAAFDSDVMLELISDGIHNHPAAVRTAFAAAGSERICLISDSIEPCGLPDGTYGPITLKDGLALNEEGTIAGSAANLFEDMLRAISFGIPPEYAIAAASINPARAIGEESTVGSITVGKAADILVLTPDYQLREVYIAGKKQ